MEHWKELFLMDFRRGGDLGFGFGDHAQSFIVGFFAFAGLAPHLLAVFALLLGTRHIDLLRLERVGGKNGDAIGQNLDESPTDVVARDAARRYR